MIFQIVPSQTQGLPLTGDQEGWMGMQDELSDVTHAFPAMHGAPSCNDDICKTRLGNLQGEKDRLEARGKKLSDEVIGLHSKTDEIKLELNKSESTVETLDKALRAAQVDLSNALLRFSKMNNENIQLASEKKGLDHSSKETVRKLNNANRVITGLRNREKAQKTLIATLKKGILPIENEDEDILADIEEATRSNTNMMARKRPGCIIPSPSSMKVAKIAKKTNVSGGIKGVNPPNLAPLSASDKKRVPQSSRDRATKSSTRVSKSPLNQKNKKKALNNCSQKVDDNDDKMGNMPPEHPANSEVPNHNLPDTNILQELEVDPLGAGGSGTQSGEGGLDLTSR